VVVDDAVSVVVADVADLEERRLGAGGARRGAAAAGAAAAAVVDDAVAVVVLAVAGLDAGADAQVGPQARHGAGDGGAVGHFDEGGGHGGDHEGAVVGRGRAVHDGDQVVDQHAAGGAAGERDALGAGDGARDGAGALHRREAVHD